MDKVVADRSVVRDMTISLLLLFHWMLLQQLGYALPCRVKERERQGE
jgi:hypothetical protein